MNFSGPYDKSFFQTLLLFVFCILCSAKSWAVACNEIFTNGIQATSASGNVSLSYHSIITGGSATLKTRTLTNGSSWAACSNSNCLASGTSAVTSTPTFSTGNAADGNISVAYQGSANYGSGNYGTVNVAQEGILKFNDNSGTYRTAGFTTGLRSEVWLRSGDYWINGNLSLGQETILRRLSPSGTTRIFVNGNVSMALRVATSSFSANQLLIYATGTITAGQEVQLSAVIYGGGNVSFGFQSVINGAVSGSSFSATGNEVRVNYQPSAFATGDFTPFCGGSSTVSYYGISVAATGVTCAAEPVIIRAYDSSGNLVAPTTGTQITLSTSPASGVWVGGNTYSFAGSETSVTKYLQQTSAATLNINLSDGTRSEISSLDPSITFANAGLRFSTIATQEAGVVDNSVTLRAVRTDTNTGACVAQVTGVQPVKLAYVCNNPTTCVSGQTLTLGGNAVQANANTSLLNPAYTTVNLTFDANGITAIPFKYSDVGRLSLVAQLSANASGVNPAITLSGTSAPFAVKPYSLAISKVEGANGEVNPIGTNVPTARFVSAGTNFKVSIQARDSSGNPTPNFGNEITSEIGDLVVTATSVTYPSGIVAVNPALSNTGTFVPTTPAGTFVNASVAWKQVGSVVITPSLTDADYLGVGNITRFTDSGTVGRFFPDRFVLNNLTFTNSCGPFAYMSQPMTFSYTLQAQATDGTKLTNFEGHYGVTNLLVNNQALPTYVAETNNTGDGVSKSSRVTAVPASTTDWNAGDYNFSGTLQFNRQILDVPDGPFDNLQLGIGVIDDFDGRSVQGADMNATTATACAPACTAKMVGSVLSMRYGRLRLDDAFGPETAPLAVNFSTEFWAGNRFVLNANDSCTTVPRSAITFATKPISVDAHRTVDLSLVGKTTGTINLDATDVKFGAGTAGLSFSAPTNAAQGEFIIGVDLTNLNWLTFDWDQGQTAGPDSKLPNATITFGSYRGHDRIIYWRERLQ